MSTTVVPVPVSALLADTPLNWPLYENCFDNIERLGRWTGGTTIVPNPNDLSGDPSSYFQSVSPRSLGAGSSPPTIYVVAHGWAPGYRAAVEAQRGRLLWWGSQASVNDVWASAWAWSAVYGDRVTFPVNPTGMLQSIVAQDPNAIVLAYSWIDNSATDSGVLNLDEVYQSEAYTHINGIRLANALQEAIASSFWTSAGQLRLIGHSHGSKVVSVAATTLRQRGLGVAHLTILDAPESEPTLEVNAANLLGFYLEEMQIADPSIANSTGAFIDNYGSCFGVGYSGAAKLRNVVEVSLDADEVYDFFEIADLHTYAAAWYGGAAAGAATYGELPLGLAWPPAPQPFQPALNQNWFNGQTEYDQWSLAAGESIRDIYSYGTQPLTVTTLATQGNVQGDPSTQLIFGPTPGAYSIFQGEYYNFLGGDGYGLGVDIAWSGPQPGEYLAFVVESPITGDFEVVAMLDGRSQASDPTSIAIASAVWSETSALSLYVLFYAESSTVTVSNFRSITVGSADGRLRARRLAKAKRRLQRIATRTAESGADC